MTAILPTSPTMRTTKVKTPIQWNTTRLRLTSLMSGNYVGKSYEVATIALESRAHPYGTNSWS